MRINKCPSLEYKGTMIKVHHIEFFYDLYGFTGVECNSKYIESLEEHKFPFLYPNPSVYCPALMLLISQVRKKRFFHGVILSTVNYLLFNSHSSPGYKHGAEGAMMSQLIPEDVIAWMCVAVQFCVVSRTPHCSHNTSSLAPHVVRIVRRCSHNTSFV